MIHQIGDVEVEVVRRGDFVSGIVYDCSGCPRIEKVPVYKATIVSQELWGRGRSPADAIGDLILTYPEAFVAHAFLDSPCSKEFFAPSLKSR